MAEIVIQLPEVNSKDRIEVEARINGKKQILHYRVEIFSWTEDCDEPAKDRALCLKRIVENYDPHWQLQQIGTYTDKTVQVMFKEKGSQTFN
jgi:hypothetical protein